MQSQNNLWVLERHQGTLQNRRQGQPDGAMEDRHCIVLELNNPTLEWLPR